MFGLDTGLTILLLVCLLAAFSFEFINGFHDTANAVATVIYTNSLRPSVAVIWSGLWNFIGVYFGGIAVAMGIVHLLPFDALIDQNINHSISMVFALVLTAIIWNLGTWYLAIPCSSSHTLIGSIFGVGIAYMLLPDSHNIALNWSKVEDIGLALLISPVIGFGLSFGLIVLLQKIIKNKSIFEEASGSPYLNTNKKNESNIYKYTKRIEKIVDEMQIDSLDETDKANHNLIKGKLTEIKPIIKDLGKKQNKILEAKKNKKPPFWVRFTLILTCTSVSFAHGSNDGQKGVGLIMIMLIGIVPAYFAINSYDNPMKYYENTKKIEYYIGKINEKSLSAKENVSYTIIKENIENLKPLLLNLSKKEDKKAVSNFQIRKNILIISDELNYLLKTNFDKQSTNNLSSSDISLLKKEVGKLKDYTEYAPNWVILLVALSLGLGTMIGWKRIVITIGERIGKSHLTYAQGASAELVAAGTIGLSSLFGLPVSTTHVLSSGIAGTMVASAGKNNLKLRVVRNIAIAWLITLPITIIMSGLLFLLFRAIFV